VSNLLVALAENTLAHSAAAKRRKPPAVRSSPRRTSGRPTRGTRSAEAMADRSDSDGDGDNDSSEEEETPKPTARRGAAAKRARGESTPGFVESENGGTEVFSSFLFLPCAENAPPPSRVSKRARSRQNGASNLFPELRKWPDIDLKAISKVVKAVLRHLSALDEEGLFSKPVVEQAPGLREIYLATIESPMDFRTIEEDRSQYYETIQELQDDLILIFRNCATFNNPSSEYHSFAM